MQNTNFSFEIIIHDDASNDKTADIIKEFALKYPDIIKPIYQVVNQHSIENGNVMKLCYGLAKGKYIAICEGDDYWIDAYKLQKQVLLLENNKNIGLVYTDIKFINSNNEELLLNHKLTYANNFNKGRDAISFFDILNFNPISTPTVIFSKNLLNKISFNKPWYVYDIWYWLHIASISKIARLPDITACYRIHDGGISNINNPFIKKRVSLVLQDSIQFYLSNNKLSCFNFRDNFILLKRILFVIFDSNLKFISKKYCFKLLFYKFYIFILPAFLVFAKFIYNKINKKLIIIFPIIYLFNK
jgi:glycosyltransferase involved in cell wall biosynthesis